MNKDSKKISFAIILLVMMLALIALFLIKQRYKIIIVDNPKSYHPTTETTTQSTSSLNSKLLIPNSVFLPVPFTPQAPTANWDELHNEACEEASVIMASEYFLGNKNTQLDPKLVEAQITSLTDWQQKTFGYHLSITTEETAQMIKEQYGLTTEIKTEYTENDIKQLLTDGKLVLFPVNGRLLNNPYFKRPGPLYHMLVIKGFDSKGNFITNDPGTKRGLNFPYTFSILYEANGEYEHKDKKVNLDKKNILIISKN